MTDAERAALSRRLEGLIRQTAADELARMDIADARREAGLTLQQAADRLGVTRRTIARWEAGEGAPTPEQVAALTSDAPAPEPRRRGRPGGAGASERMVPCPVRVTPAAAAIARERGSAWLSALVEGADYQPPGSGASSVRSSNAEQDDPTIRRVRPSARGTGAAGA